MVIVELRGGLGNQMSQYAAGLSIASRKQTRLKVDTTFYDRYADRIRAIGTPTRRVGLHQLSIPLRHPNWLESRVLAASNRIEDKEPRVLDPFLAQIIKFENWARMKPGFTDDVFSRSAHIYLRGNWHSWRHFGEIRQVLLKDFATSLPLDEDNARMLQHIQTSNSVGVHVRRGDYLNHSETNALFGVCPPSYYADAIGLLKTMVPNPIFFLFSDDLPWAAANLNGDNVVLVDCNAGASPALDMRLMSNCAHFITANSTFSWWGAWLSQRQDKLVLTPKKWYKAGWSTKDLLPKHWLKVPNDLV